MLHPLFTLLIRKPELLMEHLAAYGALVHEEVNTVGTHWVARMAAWAAMGVMLVVFLVLAGVAAMLGAMQQSFHWALIAVPGAALLLAVICYAIARKPLPTHQFAEIKAQVDADLLALRMAGEGQ